MQQGCFETLLKMTAFKVWVAIEIDSRERHCASLKECRRLLKEIVEVTISRELLKWLVKKKWEPACKPTGELPIPHKIKRLRKPDLEIVAKLVATRAALTLA